MNAPSELPDSKATSSQAMRLLRSRALIPLTVTVLSMAMTVAVWTRIKHSEVEGRQADMAREIALISVEVRDKLRGNAQGLRGIRAFLGNSTAISPVQWNTYTRQLNIERHTPGLQAYGFARRIRSGEAGALTPAIFSSTQPPAPAESFTILHVAPDSADAKRLLGFDLYSDAKVRPAITLARDTDEVTLSGRTTTRMDDSRPAVLIMTMPVFTPSVTARRVPERQRDITGVAYAIFQVSTFMESLHSVHNSTLGLRIFDDETSGGERPGQGLTLLFDSFPESAKYSHPIEEREIEFGYRKWLLQFQPKAPLPILRESTLLLGGGLAISLLLGLLTGNLSTRRQQAEIYAKKVNTELHQSEERFQLASKGTNDGIWDYELGGSQIYASERLEGLLGYAPGSMPSDINFLVSRIHPADVAAFRSANTRHVRDRAPYDVEYRMLKSDNSWGWFRSRGQAVWNAAGRAVRMAGSVADISQRKEAEARLRHYKDFLQTVLKSIPHPIFVKDRGGFYIMVNTAMCELANRDEKSFIGARHFNNAALFTDAAEKLAAMDVQVFETGKAQQDEFELPINGRGLRTVIVSKALATDPDGKPILIGAVADVTEQRHAEYAILQTNRKLQSVLDAATELAIIATDTRGMIRTFNRGAEKMLGYDASDMISRQTPAIWHVEREVLQRCTELSAELGRPIAGFDAFITIAQVKGAELREWTYVRKDGSTLTVSLAVTAVRDEENEISGYLGIAIDISERKRAEAELLHHRDHLRELVADQTAGLLLAKEIAERASQTKSEFLANMSHEMRTPMHAVLSFAGLGEEKSAALQADKLQQYFQRIRQSGERLLRLLNDLLDLSKLEAGKMHVEPRLNDVRPLIVEACEEFESLMSSRHIQLSIDEAGRDSNGNPCDTRAMCDPVRFGQVIRNLLSNAIKFSPDHGRIIIAFERSTQTLGRRVNEKTTLPILRISITDEGVGIPPAELDAIFEKFVQSSKTKSGAGGTGLGLAICQEIMNAHRGTIEACNNAGRGASFIVQLQVNPAVFNHLPSREA